jgi:hypothetical protein
MVFWTDGFLRRGIRNQKSKTRTPIGNLLVSDF